MRVAAALLTALAAVALAGCGEGAVVRIVDGRPVRGRFIPETAYALYAHGAEAEAAGDLGGAIAAFQLAVAEDPESPEIWTRLGALRCWTAPVDTVPPAAEVAFARAAKLDPSYGPAHRERARCLLSKNGASPETALAEAERALALIRTTSAPRSSAPRRSRVRAAATMRASRTSPPPSAAPAIARPGARSSTSSPAHARTSPRSSAPSTPISWPSAERRPSRPSTRRSARATSRRPGASPSGPASLPASWPCAPPPSAARRSPASRPRS